MLVALIVIGPKDLPRLARNIGQWVAKGRAMAREFQRSLEDMAREAELDDVKREIEKVGRIDIKKSIERTIDPSGDLGKAFDPNSSSKPRPTPGAANGQAKEPAQVASDVAQPTAPTPVRTTKAEAVAAAAPSGPPPAAAAPEAPVKTQGGPVEGEAESGPAESCGRGQRHDETRRDVATPDEREVEDRRRSLGQGPGTQWRRGQTRPEPGTRQALHSLPGRCAELNKQS